MHPRSYLVAGSRRHALSFVAGAGERVQEIHLLDDGRQLRRSIRRLRQIRQGVLPVCPVWFDGLCRVAIRSR